MHVWAATLQPDLLAQVWTGIHDRLARRLADDTEAVDPTALDAAWTSAAALLPPDQVPRRGEGTRVRRVPWRELRQQCDSLTRLRGMQAPTVIIADYEGCVARSLGTLWEAPTPAVTPPLPLQRRVDTEGNATTFPDLWAILETFARAADPFGDRNLGIGTALGELPSHREFIAAHPTIWPDAVSPLDNDTLGFDRATVSRDIYPSPDLWRPRGWTLPHDVFSPPVIDRRVPDLLGGLSRSGVAHVGVGRHGGPMTFATNLAEVDSPFAAMIGTALGPDRAVVCYVWLAPDPG
jgi:hypothetical protein